jgi:hypothetical protein
MTRLKYLNYIYVLFISITSLAQSPQHRNIEERSDWKTYTNLQYGFTFQYPDSWIEDENINRVINLKGEITSISIVFKDPNTNSYFTVEYFFAPEGAELYNYAVSQYNSNQGFYQKDAKKLIVAGKEAIQGNLISTIDGKGNKLDKPLSTTVVEFLDKKQSGEIRIQFRVYFGNNIEIKKFNKLLSTFSFMNDVKNNVNK